MNKRLELHETLCGIINITEPNGDRHTYFAPPESIKMKYPAIRYSLDNIRTNRADNRIYKKSPGYLVTLIDENSDSEYVEKLLELPYCEFIRSYVSNNLNHFVFKIYSH